MNKHNLNCLRFSYNDHESNFHIMYVKNMPFYAQFEQIDQVSVWNSLGTIVERKVYMYIPRSVVYPKPLPVFAV